MFSCLRQPFFKFLSSTFLLSAILVATPAHATYKYVYTGNAFGVGITPDDPLWSTSINAVILSPELITGEPQLISNLNFSLTSTYDGFSPSWPNHNGGSIYTEEGSWVYYNTFNIYAVDAAGLPLVWDIGIEYAHGNITGNGGAHEVRTSSIRGDFEGVYNMGGPTGSTLNLGTWQLFITDDVTLPAPPINPVPEPFTYALMVTGLGLVLFAGKRRNRKMDNGSQTLAMT